MNTKDIDTNEDEVTADVIEAELPDQKLEDQPNEDDKASEYLAGWQRALADYKNLQERMTVQSAITTDVIKAMIFTDLIPVLDNFSAGLSHVPEDRKNDDWVVGLFHVKQQLLDTCRKHGLELIDQVDVDFDPNIHEAVSHEPSDKPPGQVLNVVSVGLRLADKVIRPAKVIIASEAKSES